MLLTLSICLTWVLVICDRALKSRAVRLHHQANRIRDYRGELADKTAENKLLGEALDRLTAQASTAQAALTPTPKALAALGLPHPPRHPHRHQPRRLRPKGQRPVSTELDLNNPGRAGAWPTAAAAEQPAHGGRHR
ncbi:hypothetical protein NKG94_34680 [Micromonospora sp. M12]